MKKVILITAIILLLASPVLADSLDSWIGKNVEVNLDISKSQKVIKGTLRNNDEQGIIVDSSEGKLFIYHYSISYIVFK